MARQVAGCLVKLATCPENDRWLAVISSSVHVVKFYAVDLMDVLTNLLTLLCEVLV